MDMDRLTPEIVYNSIQFNSIQVLLNDIYIKNTVNHVIFRVRPAS